MVDPFNFASLGDKTALVTGASAGIGWETARLTASMVKSITLIARRKERLAQLKSIIEDTTNCRVRIYSGDIMNRKFIEELLNENVFKTDILINNAGLALGLADVVDADVVDWETMIHTNMTSAFIIAKHCASHMRAQKSGHIVNIASIAGHVSYAKGSVYCATKHGLLAFSKALRSELCDASVRVTSISPGMVESEFSLVRFKGDDNLANVVYSGFKPLLPIDIARQILFCLLQEEHINIDEICVTPQAQGEVGKNYSAKVILTFSRKRNSLRPIFNTALIFAKE